MGQEGVEPTEWDVWLGCVGRGPTTPDAGTGCFRHQANLLPLRPGVAFVWLRDAGRARGYARRRNRSGPVGPESLLALSLHAFAAHDVTRRSQARTGHQARGTERRVRDESLVRIRTDTLCTSQNRRGSGRGAVSPIPEGGAAATSQRCTAGFAFEWGD